MTQDHRLAAFSTLESNFSFTDTHRASSSTETTLKAMTFNVAHGRGRRFHQAFVKRHEMEDNLRQIAQHILQHSPDIVALQEIDQHSFWNHRMDQLAFLHGQTQYEHARHGIHMSRHLGHRFVLNYGVGILSRLEPIDFSSFAFSEDGIDSKGFTSKILLHHGRRILVIALHLDFRSYRRQKRQLAHVISHVRELRGYHDHCVVMGDFNCTLEKMSSPLWDLMHELKLHTHEPHRNDIHISFPGFVRKRLDYVLIDDGLDFVRYETGNARLSDHEYVVATLRYAAN